MSQPTAIECSNREEWLKRRGERVGASEVPTVLGLNPWQTRWELGQIKAGRVPPFAGNEATAIGEKLQGTILGMYEHETGRLLEYPAATRILQNPDYPDMHATLDGEVLPSAEMKLSRGPVEAKNVGARMVGAWEDAVPLYVQAQLQAQMAVMGATWGSIAALLGGSQFTWKDFELLPKFVAWAAEECAKFMWEVANDKLGDPSGSERDTAAVKAMFPTHVPEKTVELSAALVEPAMRILELKVIQKTAKAALAVEENRLRMAIGDGEVGVLPDGSRWSCKLQKRAAYTAKATEFRVLRRLKP